MNVSTKRLLSILLSLAMVLAMLPMAVFAETATTLYVKPNANWKADGARFAAYFFGNGDTWVDCTDADGDGVYEVEAPAGYPNVIFCRMNPNAAANNWNNKWNQTSDLNVPTDSKVCYVVAENTWDKGAGQWVEYTPEGGAGETEPTEPNAFAYYVAGDAGLCGVAWNEKYDDNGMTDEDGDGIYTKVYSEVAAGTYGFKVTDGTWGNAWPTSNYKLELAAKSNVTINFNTADNTITVETEALEEPVVTEPVPATYIVAGVPELCGTGWNPEDTNNLMSDEDGDGIYSITYPAVAAGTYLFKVTDGSWNNSWGGTAADGNYEFTLVAEADVTINFNSADNSIEVVSDGFAQPEPSEPFVPGVREYCLIGYINGADYGCNDDYENIGEYIFVDGTLTTSFATNSYVFVKTTDNANWFMTEAFCEATTGTFVTGGTEKMLVPGGVELTFTLVENEDGSVTVSYVTGDPVETESTEPSSEEPVAATYYVAGDFNSWNQKDEAYLMAANEDGTYSLSFDVTAGNHQLKVTNGTWDVSWGAATASGNYEFSASADGTITVAFDGANITVTGDVVGEPEPEPLTINTMHVVGALGLTGADWDPKANQMDSAMGVYSITFTGIAAGTYEFKFAANGTWDLNWASGVEVVSGETATAWFNSLGNSSVVVAEDDSTVTLSLDLTHMDMFTGEGATMCVTVEAPDNALSLGDNALSLAAGDTDGNTWTYTATEAGTLSINVTALATDDGTGVVADVPAEYIAMVMARNFGVQVNGATVMEYPATVEVAAGDTVSVLIYSGMGMATNLTLNLDLAAAEAPVNALNLGDNALTLAAGDTDGNTWTYTATEAGTLSINVTALATDDGTGVVADVPADYIGMVIARQYSVVINGTAVYEYPATVSVAAGDTVTVLIASGMGAATNLTLNLVMGEAVEPEPAEPGTQGNPIVIESLPYEITVEGEHNVYYTYTAEADGTIKITRPEGNFVSELGAFTNDADGNYYITVTAGQVITINPWGSNAGSYTIAYGEAPAVENVPVYFDTSLYGWNEVKAYAWNDNGDMLSGDWPGTAMTLGEDGLWTIEIPENAQYIIFSCGDYQTWDLPFYGNSVYDGWSYDAYGTELVTNFYVTGAGVFGEWATVTDHVLVPNGDGTMTVTVNNVEAGDYGYKVIFGEWDNGSNWGDWSTEDGNCHIVLDAKSDVTITFNLNTYAISAEATPVVEEVPSVKPTLKLKAPTLEFKDMITVNAFFTAENIEDVVEMGMITYSYKSDVVSVETAEHRIPGAAYIESSGRYLATSQGIHAKYLGDTVYLAVYAELKDGSFVYTILAPYSPVDYATNQIKNSTNVQLKQLCAAMLNYGAEAQLFFGHNTSALANASLTDEQKALPEAYRADMVAAVPAASAAKQGEFANNKGFAKRTPSISFEGAFCINYFFTPNYAPVDGITMYYWNEADYNAVEVLTTENASGSFKMNGSGVGQYNGSIEGIAAKALSEAVYVAAVYSDGTTTWTSGVLGYSIGSYCSSQASKGAAVSNLAMATAVYGYQAKQYFG